MSKKKGLPGTTFVTERSEDDGKWLDCVKSIKELAEMGETIEVGVYKLVKTQKVKGVVEIS